MPTLHLLRHAKSSWEDPSLADVDRPLSARGERDAERLARAIARVERALCSPARRARETLAPIARRLGASLEVRADERLFDADGAEVAQVIADGSRGAASILVVGHEPGLSRYLASLDLAGDATLLAALRTGLPTGTLVTLELDRSLRHGTLVSAMRARRGAIVRDFDGTREEAVTASRIGLDADASRRRGARIVLDSVRAHVDGNLRGAEHGDAESVHQLRVALRRARVALWIFRRELAPGTRALRDELRWLARELGPLREAQVLAEAVGDADEALAAALRAEIAAQGHHARAALRAERGRQAIAALRALSIRRGASRRSLASLSRKRIRRRAEAVLERWSALDSRDDAAVHELRKELKKLRYALAMLAGDDEDALTRGLSRMQDELGAAQDRASALRLFDAGLAPRIADASRAGAREALRRALDAAPATLTSADAIRASVERLRGA